MYLYREKKTIFHSLHPLTKLAVFALLIVICFLPKTVPAMLLVLCSAVLFLVFAGGAPNLKSFWKLMVLFWIFTFLIWIFIPRWQHLPWSFENAARLATRIDSFVAAGLFFVTITRIEEFTLALTKIGIPYKGAFALSLGFRLVPLFYQNLQTIVAAQQSRGVDLKSGGLFARAKNYIPIFGILISYSLRNADLMAMSLEAKGFGYSPHRTSYLQPKLSWRDLVFLAAGLLVIVYFLL